MIKWSHRAHTTVFFLPEIHKPDTAKKRMHHQSALKGWVTNSEGNLKQQFGSLLCPQLCRLRRQDTSVWSWRRPLPSGAAPEQSRPGAPGAQPDRTFVGRLGVGCQRDVIQLAQAQPLSIHGHAEFAKIDGLHGSLSDLVCGGGWHVALRRQSRHDDSAGTTTTGAK